MLPIDWQLLLEWLREKRDHHLLTLGGTDHELMRRMLSEAASDIRRS